MQKSIFTGSFPADPVVVQRAWISCSSYLYQTLLLPARRTGRSLAVVRPLVATGQEAQQRLELPAWTNTKENCAFSLIMRLKVAQTLPKTAESG